MVATSMRGRIVSGVVCSVSHVTAPLVQVVAQVLDVRSRPDAVVVLEEVLDGLFERAVK